MLSLGGKRALITGGSRGIGRAAVLLFARLGARVAFSFARDREAAGALEGEAGGQAAALEADLSRVEAAEDLVARAEAALGGLDILVVNHGIWKRAPLAELGPEEWAETLDLNLRAAWALCRAAAPRLSASGGGAIVTVASTAGQRGEMGYAHYAASKGGLIAFTKSLAAELGPLGIRVNAVAPGWVLTDMTRDALEGPEGQAALEKIPRGRPGSPEEVAGPIAFLASDLASYVYGEVLCVNGGAVMAG